MSHLRFGIVGCGGIVTMHALPALKRCPKVQVVAVTDLDARWAARVARRFAVPESFSDYQALIGRADAVLVATPNATHADIACRLLEHGVHVLCEKPAATSVDEVDRMYTAAERGHARLMIAHTFRFSPNLAFLTHIVANEWLGEIRSITAGIGNPYEAGAQRTDFRRDRALSGGGVLIDLGIHLIDLAIWLLESAPESVRYLGTSAAGWKVESDAEILLRFPGDARVTLSASFTQALENEIVVRGADGWARAPLYDPSALIVCTSRARVCQRQGTQEVLLPDQSIYERQVSHFCSAVEGGREFVVGSPEIRAGIKVVEECYRQVA